MSFQLCRFSAVISPRSHTATSMDLAVRSRGRGHHGRPPGTPRNFGHHAVLQTLRATLTHTQHAPNQYFIPVFRGQGGATSAGLGQEARERDSTGGRVKRPCIRPSTAAADALLANEDAIARGVNAHT
ncbi:hypothetical protein QE152_g26089 [Popillia japonica]|uniref:Uncharacterized protein n=1 Tax=Popillia japonica TaxID=7064 RepID=A0AAW1JYY2_POPJA